MDIKKILVIDDDPDVLDAIQLTLETNGYQVKATQKGEYAENLHDTSNNLPALIILDILLSGKDGRDICKKLKNQDETKQIPVLLISAHPNAEKSAREVGADDFLAKPFGVSDLLKKVRENIKKTILEK